MRLALRVGSAPSGVSSDDGAMLSPVPRIDLTVAFGPGYPLDEAFDRIGDCEVEFLRVTHSMPDCVALAIETLAQNRRGIDLSGHDARGPRDSVGHAAGSAATIRGALRRA